MEDTPRSLIHSSKDLIELSSH